MFTPFGGEKIRADGGSRRNPSASPLIILALAVILVAAPLSSATSATFEDSDDFRPARFVGTSVIRDCGSGDLGLGYPLDPGHHPLVSTWRFDCPSDPVRDSWGDNDGSTHGATRTDAGLLSTRGMQFDPDDGTIDWVAVQNDASLNQDAFTLSLWVNPDEVGDRQFVVSKAGDTARGYALELRPDGRFMLYIGDGDGYHRIESQTQARPGNWYHVAATYDAASTTAKLFVNATKEAESTSMGEIAHDTGGLLFGSHPGDVTRFPYDGRLEEIRFHDEAMRDGSIQQLELYRDNGIVRGAYSTVVDSPVTRLWTSFDVQAAVPTWTGVWVWIEALDGQGQVLDQQRIILQGSTTVELSLPPSEDARIRIEGEATQLSTTWRINEMTLFSTPDHDGDGLSTQQENELGSDPHDPDTDDDGLEDGPEVHRYGTEVLDPDTDGDLHADGTEVDEGSDPTNPLSVPLIVTGTPDVEVDAVPNATDPLPPVR